MCSVCTCREPAPVGQRRPVRVRRDRQQRCCPRGADRRRRRERGAHHARPGRLLACRRPDLGERGGRRAAGHADLHPGRQARAGGQRRRAERRLLGGPRGLGEHRRSVAKRSQLAQATVAPPISASSTARRSIPRCACSVRTQAWRRTSSPSTSRSPTDSKTACVTLQEANAVAVVDMPVRRLHRAFMALGFKDHGLTGNELDAERPRRAAINIVNWPVRGHVSAGRDRQLRAPRRRPTIVTANEGDARD